MPPSLCDRESMMLARILCSVTRYPQSTKQSLLLHLKIIFRLPRDCLTVPIAIQTIAEKIHLDLLRPSVNNDGDRESILFSMDTGTELTNRIDHLLQQLSKRIDPRLGQFWIESASSRVLSNISILRDSGSKRPRS